MKKAAVLFFALFFCGGVVLGVEIDGIVTGIEVGDTSAETADLPTCTGKAPMPNDDSMRIHVANNKLPDCNPANRVGEKPKSVFLQLGDYGYEPGIYTENVQELIEVMENQFATENGFSNGFDFVFTSGDNAYEAGHCAEYIANNEKYERFFVHTTNCTDPPINFDVQPLPLDDTRWFPTAGNHDWDTFQDFPFQLPYIQYWPWLLTLDPPGFKARGHFYSIIPVPGLSLELFSLNSNLGQNGMSDESLKLHQTQIAWLGKVLAESTAEHRWVFFHHPPYSTAQSDALAPWMDIPFEALGATAVWNGHEHVYERMMKNEDRDGAGDFPYILNGFGGNPTLYELHNCQVQPGSQVRFNSNHGAAVGLVYDDAVDICVYSVEEGGLLVDSFQLEADPRETKADSITDGVEEEPLIVGASTEILSQTPTAVWIAVIVLVMAVCGLSFALYKQKKSADAKQAANVQRYTELVAQS